MFGSGKADMNVAEYAALSTEEFKLICNDFLLDKSMSAESSDVILSCAKIALPMRSVKDMRTLVVVTCAIIREFAGTRLESNASAVLKGAVQICGQMAKKDSELRNDFLEKMVYLALTKSTYPKDRVRDMFSKGRYSDVKKMVSGYYSPKSLELSRVMLLKNGNKFLEDMLTRVKSGK